MSLRLTVLPDRFAVCRCERAPEISSLTGGLVALVRTEQELSLVCAQAEAPASAKVEKGWRALKVEGPLPFHLTGILHGILTPLAARGIAIFAVSTYDTDYVLLKDERLAEACEALSAAGYELLK